ncbi:MAG: SDR family oxidoreductase [Clostridia bacterium]|nr:SDR family oxidoreductase [Clostridia bacterium]
MTNLETLVSFSRRYGADENFVLAGGGNTSYKDDVNLYIKGSGTSLAQMTEDKFVKMNRAALADIWTKTYSDVTADREAEVLADLMLAREPGESAKRPSVETLLHDLFPQKFVLHVHPASVNGLTCSVNAKSAALDLFPECVWVDESEPGYVLAALCRGELSAYAEKMGKAANLVFLQNHGVFFAADSESELDALVADVMAKIDAKITTRPDFSEVEVCLDTAAEIAPAIRMLYDENGMAKVKFEATKTVLDFASSEEAFAPLKSPLSPDHIVYCKAEPLFVEYDGVESLKAAFDAFVARRSFKPKVIFVKGIGMFTVGATVKEAATAAAVWRDAMKITVFAESFGGVSHMKPALADFIVNWEVESYRSKVSLAGGAAKPLSGKIAVVTGSAQGFGEGIARHLAMEGAAVVIADMNADGAAKTAAAIAEETGADTIAVSGNVSDEDSVKAMMQKTVLALGGCDVFVNNAGIVRAGSLEEMTKSNFELVTAVNYTAYFLCAKYASAIMKIQRKISPAYMSDIIEINSKSGLAGSNKNFAYAGSKFGGIGLTQSFALELAPYGIKVNAVCPGNFLDGPLWSDPERGLFVQYLKAGKVPGAKTVADVKAFYESKVPLGRGCLVEDVARAVLYIIAQKYETGQALPVTGGQEMLK